MSYSSSEHERISTVSFVNVSTPVCHLLLGGVTIWMIENTPYASMKVIPCNLVIWCILNIENTWIPFISVDCTIGHYPNASDDSACIPCEIGFYKDETGAVNCTACPSGFSTVDMGSTNKSECYGRGEIDKCCYT